MGHSEAIVRGPDCWWSRETRSSQWRGLADIHGEVLGNIVTSSWADEGTGLKPRLASMWTLHGGSRAASQEPEDGAFEVVPRQVTVAAYNKYSLTTGGAESARLFIWGCNTVTKALSLLPGLMVTLVEQACRVS